MYRLNRTLHGVFYKEFSGISIGYDRSPCENCGSVCDGWEARYCCTLCRHESEEPDCDNCDPWDI